MVKETDVKEMLTILYNQEFTESGSPEGKSENGMSVENVKFMKILEDEENFQTANTRHGRDYHTYRKVLTKIRSLRRTTSGL